MHAGTPNGTDLLQVRLTVYYDESCPLCRGEINALRVADVHREVDWIDCSPADFSDEACEREGIDRAELMRVLHLRTADGDWLTGPAAFARLYAQLGMPIIARLWDHPLLRPFWRVVYPWVARHRQRLSRIGVARTFSAWVHPVAARAAARRARCTTASCERTSA